jgi:hypothetical protein
MAWRISTIWSMRTQGNRRLHRSPGPLRADGVLILDVRDWHSTATRKAREPLFRKRVDTRCGKLTCTSVTELDAPTRRLVLRERPTLEANGLERSSDYEFVMRCWTPDELQSLLRLNGFGSVAYFGAYDPALAPDVTDRLVAVAQLSGRAGNETGPVGGCVQLS